MATGFLQSFGGRVERLFQVDEGELAGWRRRALRAAKLGTLTLRKIGADFCLERAATLSFAATIAAIPLSILLVFLFKSFGTIEESVAQLKDFLAQYVNEDSRDAVNSNIDQLAQGLDSSQAKAVQGVSFVAVVLAALALYRSAERTFCAIWSCRAKRGFFQKLGTFWLLLTAAPLILTGSLYVKESLRSHLDDLATSQAIEENVGAKPEDDGRRDTESRPVLTFFRDLVLNWLFPVAISFFAFSLLYVCLPNARVKLNGAAISALVAACCWQLGTFGFITYIQTAPITGVYGALGVVPSFLIWVYLSWLIALCGAALNYCIQNYAVLDREVRFHIQRERVSRSVLAVLFMDAIYSGFRGARPTATVESLATRFKVPLSEVAAMLDVLKEAEFIVSDSRGAVTPRRSADQVSPLEVMQAFPRGTGFHLPPDLCRETATGALLHQISSGLRDDLTEPTFEDLLEDSSAGARETAESSSGS